MLLKALMLRTGPPGGDGERGMGSEPGTSIRWSRDTGVRSSQQRMYPRINLENSLFRWNVFCPGGLFIIDQGSLGPLKYPSSTTGWRFAFGEMVGGVPASDELSESATDPVSSSESVALNKTTSSLL